MDNKNPYSKLDGTPKPGKELEFLDWAIQQNKKSVSNLPKEQQQKVKKAQQRLSDKMQS